MEDEKKTEPSRLKIAIPDQGSIEVIGTGPFVRRIWEAIDSEILPEIRNALAGGNYSLEVKQTDDELIVTRVEERREDDDGPHEKAPHRPSARPACAEGAGELPGGTADRATD